MQSGKTCVIGQTFGNYFEVVEGARFSFQPRLSNVFYLDEEARYTLETPKYTSFSKRKTEAWAIKHGFQKKYALNNEFEYDVLAFEWTRVIESRLLEEKYQEGMPSVSPVQNVVPRERVLVKRSVRPEPVQAAKSSAFLDD